MKIRRVVLFNMHDYEWYIKQKSEIVSHVYGMSIYFFIGPGNYFGWDARFMCKEKEDTLLKMINALCGTDFEFEDDNVPENKQRRETALGHE